MPPRWAAALGTLVLVLALHPTAALAWGGFGGGCNNPSTAAESCYLRKPERPALPTLRRGYEGASNHNDVLTIHQRPMLQSTNCETLGQSSGSGGWISEALGGGSCGGTSWAQRVGSVLGFTGW